MGRDDGWRPAQRQGLSYGSQGLPLGSAHAWQDNQYSILPCGHTHNEVGWMFSLLARVLQGRDYFTEEGMLARARESMWSQLHSGHETKYIEHWTEKLMRACYVKETIVGAQWKADFEGKDEDESKRKGWLLPKIHRDGPVRKI